jgi:hypothetical protein
MVMTSIHIGNKAFGKTPFVNIIEW